MKRILIIEDDKAILRGLVDSLKAEHFEVDTSSDGEEGLSLARKHKTDVLILDIMLPKVDGYAITRWLRDRSDVPIIILTSRREETDRIAGLEMGADDYVVKPFSPQEVVSRVRAVMRRARSGVGQNGDAPLVFGEMRIEPQTRLVSIQGNQVELTAKEFDLLLHLGRHPRQVFTRDQLLEVVWGLSDYIDPSKVTVHIRRLREKIEPNPASPQRLLTVCGVGYKFEP